MVCRGRARGVIIAAWHTGRYATYSGKRLIGLDRELERMFPPRAPTIEEQVAASRAGIADAVERAKAREAAARES